MMTRIEFNCKCGTRLKAVADLAGSRVRCTDCGNFVMVPQGPRTTTVPQTPRSTLKHFVAGTIIFLVLVGAFIFFIQRHSANLRELAATVNIESAVKARTRDSARFPSRGKPSRRKEPTSTPQLGHINNDQWAEWISDNDLESKKQIYFRIPDAWAAADEEARQNGLFARRDELYQPPVDLDKLNLVLEQIEEIEERKFRELADALDVPVQYLRAINFKGASEGW